MEIWISPEMASEIEDGSVITIIVNDKKKIGNGFLVSGEGTVIAPSGQLKQIKEELTEEPVTVAAENTPAKEKIEEEAMPQADIIEDIEKQIEEDVPPVTEGGISFGERGPQLINGEDTPDSIEEEPAKTAVASVTNSNLKIISSITELYEELAKIDESEMEEVDISGMTQDQRRELAVEMEKKGKMGCGFSAYVKNTCGGQLVISDIDVRIRHGDSYDLGKVAASRLMNSVELFEAINGKLLEFVDAETALNIKKATERRLAEIDEEIGSVEVYDGYEDVYDAINEDDYDSYDDDPMPRTGQSAQSRQSASVDNRFRRGIKTAGGRRGQDRAAVEAPHRFRDMEQQNILSGEDKYEFDKIFDAISSREAELSS